MDTPVIVHALAASYALLLGPVNMVRSRRDRAHRLIGRTWAAAILLTCMSSFGIHPHGFSWLHGLAVFTLASVTAGVIHIRRGNVSAHRGNMIGSYIGTLIAFAFAVAIPERAVARMAVEDPVSLVGAVGLVAATSAVLVGLTIRATTHESGRAAPPRVLGRTP